MEGASQLVSIVGQLVGDEYRQLSGVGAQVAELSDELDTMNAILRMLSDADEGAIDHFIRVWMKQVRELAYDAEDCIHLYILRIRCRPRDRFLVWSRRMLATLFPRRRLAREIEALRARAVVISERHARYGISREALTTHYISSSAPALVLDHALGLPATNDPDNLVGITEQANKLAEMVEAVNDPGMKLKVFSIVGFGGLGKTTLAMEVCRQLEGEFQRQAQVSVSQAFGVTKDLEGLLKRMLRQIVNPKADNMQGIKKKKPHSAQGKKEKVPAKSTRGNKEVTLLDTLRAVREVLTGSAQDSKEKDQENDLLERAQGIKETESPKSTQGIKQNNQEIFFCGENNQEIDLAKNTQGITKNGPLESAQGIKENDLAENMQGIKENDNPKSVQVIKEELPKNAQGSQEDDPPENTQGIMEIDPLEGIDKMCVNGLTNKLMELLKGKRYLIVIDDVWAEATWKAIRFKLPECNNGSRIIVTTRIEAVAEVCSNAKDCIYRIKPLNFEDSKKLFLSRAFGSKNGPYPSDLEEEMGKILKKCGGLPMAIISIAGLLASYKSSESIDMWQRIRKSIGSHMESHPTLEGMKQIVTLSYNHLHYYLKGCMMYISIFPEDYVMEKNRLLKRWIAEGLVAGIRGLTLMEVAEAYYNELVSRSMIDRAGNTFDHFDGRLEMCRVHDMVLEVMVSKSLEANFVSLVGGPYEGMSYGSIRRLSIHGGEEIVSDDSPPNKTAAWHGRNNGIEGMSMEHVRSLSMFDLQVQTQVLDRLGEFTLLRVLDLEDCMGIEDKHLRHVCRMYLLKFLSLKGTAISKMPTEVGELENLEMLDVRQTGLQDLPETVSKLETLEHLQISNKDNSKCWIARRGLGRMKALRTLNRIFFGRDADAAKELGELQQLRELSIIMDTMDPYDALHESVTEKLAESLNKMYSLRWLSIGNSGSENQDENPLDFSPRDENVLNFIHDLNPQQPRLLQYLRISIRTEKMPDWVKSLNNLVEVFFSWTYFVGDELFGPICMLPNLKRMHLESHHYNGPELVAETCHGFPALKDLYVTFQNERGALRFEEEPMVKLETLSVRFLGRYSKSVVGIENLTSLKEVKLTGENYNIQLLNAVEQLKEVNTGRKGSNLIKVAVQYE